MQNLSYGRIIALCTKEDIMGWWWGGGGAHFLQVIIQSKLFCLTFESLDNIYLTCQVTIPVRKYTMQNFKPFH